MNIPDPVALPGQEVLARNYRMKPAAWERGKVLDSAYTPPYAVFNTKGEPFACGDHWRYEVWIERPVTVDFYGRRRGGGYRLALGDDGVRPL